MNVFPGATYETVLQTGTTGLVTTIQVGLYDGQGNVTEALSALDIIETPAGSGVYVATRTAPDEKGQYVIVWSLDGTLDPAQVSVEELQVTSDAVPPVGAPVPIPYATRAELAGLLRVDATANADALDRVLVAAAFEIDNELGRATQFDDPPPAIVVEVNLERAAEHWQQLKSPFGFLGITAESAPAFAATDSWKRHAEKLSFLKESWGLA